MKAIADSTGRTLQKIREQYEVEGDLGKVAQVTFFFYLHLFLLIFLPI